MGLCATGAGHSRQIEARAGFKLEEIQMPSGGQQAIVDALHERFAVLAPPRRGLAAELAVGTPKPGIELKLVRLPGGAKLDTLVNEASIPSPLNTVSVDLIAARCSNTINWCD